MGKKSGKKSVLNRASKKKRGVHGPFYCALCIDKKSTPVRRSRQSAVFRHAMREHKVGTYKLCTKNPKCIFPIYLVNEEHRCQSYSAGESRKGPPPLHWSAAGSDIASTSRAPADAFEFDTDDSQPDDDDSDYEPEYDSDSDDAVSDEE